MRRASKVDGNQAAIVKALRDAGCGVLDLSGVGKGCPDLLVHAPTFPDCRMAVLLEVKNPKGKNKINEAQEEFRQTWKGWVHVVRSVDEALAVMGVG